MSIVQVNALNKEFRRHRRYDGAFGAVRTLFSRDYIVHKAVEDVSFSIEEGEAVGYVGPNGAGKSTTIKMLTGILVPTSGELLVNGRTPHENRRENAKILGAVFGQRSQLWWDLPVIDSFELHQHVYDISDADYKRTLSFCRDVLQLDPFLQSPVRQLSLGQRMRAEMAMALLHEPRILFLDEPTIGLDVLAKDRIREFLRTINRDRNVTIILTTHDLKDIEEICPRLIMINQGKVMFDNTIAHLKSTVGEERELKIEFESDPGHLEIPDATITRADGVHRSFRFGQQNVSVMALLNEIGTRHPIRDIAIEEVGIEAVIRTLYTQSGEDMPEAAETDSWSRNRVVVQ